MLCYVGGVGEWLKSTTVANAVSILSYKLPAIACAIKIMISELNTISWKNAINISLTLLVLMFSFPQTTHKHRWTMPTINWTIWQRNSSKSKRTCCRRRSKFKLKLNSTASVSLSWWSRCRTWRTTMSHFGAISTRCRHFSVRWTPTWGIRCELWRRHLHCSSRRSKRTTCSRTWRRNLRVTQSWWEGKSRRFRCHRGITRRRRFIMIKFGLLAAQNLSSHKILFWNVHVLTFDFILHTLHCTCIRQTLLFSLPWWNRKKWKNICVNYILKMIKKKTLSIRWFDI